MAISQQEPHPYSKPSPSTLHQDQVGHFVPRSKHRLGPHPTWDCINILRAISRSLQQTERSHCPRGGYHKDRRPINSGSWTPETGMITPQSPSPGTQSQCPLHSACCQLIFAWSPFRSSSLPLTASFAVEDQRGYPATETILFNWPPYPCGPCGVSTEGRLFSRLPKYLSDTV